jgi:hypothetical protein
MDKMVKKITSKLLVDVLMLEFSTSVSNGAD